MTTGIILAVLVLFEVANVVFRRVTKGKSRKFFAKAHMVVGSALVAFSIVHMILTLPLIKQRPFVMYVVGFIMIALGLMQVFTYVFRKKLKKYWLLLHRIGAVGMVICLAIHAYLGFSSLGQYKNAIAEIENANMDLSQVEDGSYIGVCDAGYVYAKVEVKVENHKMIKVQIIEHRTERGQKAEKITNEMQEKQQTKVDAVTSATNSSKVIMKATENAVRKGIKVD